MPSPRPTVLGVNLTDSRKPLAPDRLPPFLINVRVHPDAVMSIPNPRCDPHVKWMLRHAEPAGLQLVRFMVAEMIASYSYLLSDEITMKEATSRLRKLRAVMIASATEGK